MDVVGIKVLLVYPSYDFGDESEGSSYTIASPPMGLLYIGAVLQNMGCSVRVFHMDCESISTEKQLTERVEQIRPDLIGLSSLSRIFRNVATMASVFKEVHPNVPVVLGGHFATYNHDRILSKYECIDFVVRGEGEETSSELVFELEKSQPDFSRVRGLSYRENGHVRINMDRPLIKNLDSLPFPAYELISHYRFGDVGGTSVSYGNVFGILATRGCLYRCRYCSCSAFSNYTVRFRSPQNVVEELLHSKGNHGVKEFIFVDDNFTFDKNRVIKICSLIREHGLDIEWHCEGRVNHADESMFRNMVRAGCKTIIFGVESGVDRILDYYRKGFIFDTAREAVRRARRAGFDNVIASFIIGAPIESAAEMWTTAKRAAELDVDYAQFNPLQIYKGTPLWNELINQKRTDAEDRWEDTMVPGFEIHSELTFDELTLVLRDITGFFYRRRSYLARQIVRSLLYRKKKVALNLFHPRKMIALLKSIGSILLPQKQSTQNHHDHYPSGP
jgi:anaerobic magnesium-protoporphyrin IX monomethyl ester cyclase